MHPLYHPHPEEITVEGILYALSDPVRARIFAGLIDSDCAKNCSMFLESTGKTLPRSTLSRHFKVLREAGLIRSERDGVELKNRTRCDELQRFTPMIQSILAAYHGELA